MALTQEDTQFIKDHLGEWLAEQSVGKPPAVYEIELRERMVRVEEEHQREPMREAFARMDERFEAAERSREEQGIAPIAEEVEGADESDQRGSTAASGRC